MKTNRAESCSLISDHWILNLKVPNIVEYNTELKYNLSTFFCNTYPSQIFFTLFFSWSPWKNMMNTDLWTWSPCWKREESAKKHTLKQLINSLCVCFLPWWGPPKDPRSLPSLRRHYRDTPSIASSQRLVSSLCWSHLPQTCRQNTVLRGNKRKKHATVCLPNYLYLT